MTCRLARTGNDLPRGWRRAFSGSVYRRAGGWLAVVTTQLEVDKPPFALSMRQDGSRWGAPKGFGNLYDAIARADEVMT